MNVSFSNILRIFSCFFIYFQYTESNYNFKSISFINSNSNAYSKSDDAIKRCETAISKNSSLDCLPNGPSFCLGLLRLSRKEYDLAIEAFKKAIEKCPTNGAAYYNLGSVYEKMIDFESAITAYNSSYMYESTKESSILKLVPLLIRKKNIPSIEYAVQICNNYLKYDPNQVSILELLGACYHQSKKFKKALEIYERAVVLSNFTLKALQNTATAAENANLLDKAQEYYSLAINSVHGSTDPNTWTKYGCFLKYRGRTTEAIQALRKAIELDPDELASETGYATVQLASLVGGLPRRTMNNLYVRDLFNGYADRFDSELCNTLSYKGHIQVANEMRRLFEIRKEKFEKVVDIGCGTGLCGPLIRNISVELLGVDISDQMIALAKSRNTYDQLILNDITSYLESCLDSSIDALVASDVFIYIGDLEQVFSLSSKVISTGGLLVFTLEELTNRVSLNLNSNRDYFLLSCGRFGHSRGYIDRLAARHGFVIEKCSNDILRTQGDLPVKSLTVVLSKKSF